MNQKERWLYCVHCKREFIGIAKHIQTICPDCMKHTWSAVGAHIAKTDRITSSSNKVQPVVSNNL